MQFTGWRPEDEEKDFADYCELCQSGLLKSNVYEWKDVESQITAEARNPFTRPIEQAVAELFERGKSSYARFGKSRQETNDCTSFGTGHGIDLTQVAQATRGIETEVFRTFQPWIYGVGKCLANQNSDNGMSISLALRHITQHGVLPADLPGLPRYSGALQKQLLAPRAGRDFFNQWKDQAVQFEIDTVRLPLDYEAWYLFSASGRGIVYGTSVRITLRNGEWAINGNWRHAMATTGRVRPRDGAIGNINSHGDGDGFMTPSVAAAVIRGSNMFGAFGIMRVARRNSTPDYSGLGGN